MKIKRLCLENFRCYKTYTEIEMSDLTAFVGKNDAGKSTILEALDIFFGEGVVKRESGDASKSGDAANVRIGVVFEGLPPLLDLDRGASTTLAAEHLLNKSGHLEIHKIYNLSIQTRKAPDVFAKALHPSAGAAAGLLQKPINDLRGLVAEMGVENNCNQAQNPSMRQAIYQAVGDLELTQQDVPLNEQGGKSIWAALEKSLPIFALFQSDRASTDQDSEVQNPMKVAIQQALLNKSDELDKIVAEVQSQAEATAQRTLDQLRESYPEVAHSLIPRFRTPPWHNLFKLDLESDDGIPLNKRGSGIRRLVLLSFFQAEAARKREERGSNVIYAIEEPEASQHPDNQEMIIMALRELAESGDQVMLTTHVPALAGLLPVESLRYVDIDPESGATRVRGGTDQLYEDIASTLGVLPDPLDKSSARVAVLVEGPTDIDAIHDWAAVLTAANEMEPIDFSRVFIAHGGGSTLKNWIERKYLDKLGLPQIYIFDSDRTSAELPATESKRNLCSQINARDNCCAFMTEKRELENYVHPAVVERLTNGQVVLQVDDLDYCDVEGVLRMPLRKVKDSAEWQFRPENRSGRPIQKSKTKEIISAYFFRNMTADEIKERCEYTNPDTGEIEYEILRWYAEIRQHLD